MLRTITERAVMLFGANGGELILHRRDRDVLELVVAMGIGASTVGREVGLGEWLAGTIWQSGRPLFGDEHSLWPETTGSGRQSQRGSVLGVSIRWRDELLGVLAVVSMKSGAFAAADAGLFELFAAHAAVAVVNARLYAEVEQLAVVDELTRLFNRRGLLTVGPREVERSRSFRHPLSVLFVDLDHFKAVNDRFSHEVGDATLRQVGERIVDTVREIDIVARYGGEEFVVLLVESDVEGAREVAERIRRAVLGSDVRTEHGRARVTVSIGVAAYGPNATDLDTLIRLADQAMYAAKEAGGNRVVVWGD